MEEEGTGERRHMIQQGVSQAAGDVCSEYRQEPCPGGLSTGRR